MVSFEHQEPTVPGYDNDGHPYGPQPFPALQTPNYPPHSEPEAASPYAETEGFADAGIETPDELPESWFVLDALAYQCGLTSKELYAKARTFADEMAAITNMENDPEEPVDWTAFMGDRTLSAEDGSSESTVIGLSPELGQAVLDYYLTTPSRKEILDAVRAEVAAGNQGEPKNLRFEVVGAEIMPKPDDVTDALQALGTELAGELDVEAGVSKLINPDNK